MNDIFRTMMLIIIDILTLFSFIQDYKKPKQERNKFLIAVKYLIILGVTTVLVSTFL